MSEEIMGSLSPYARRPPRAMLPGSPAERRLRARLAEFFLVRMLVAVPDDLVSALSALVEPFERALRLLGRLLHGPGRRGDWDSEAGRLALALHGFHWTHRQTETEDPPGAFTAEPGKVTVRSPWGRGGTAREEYAAACTLRRIPRLRRRPARVDLAFADGSWLALAMNTRGDAARLRADLTG
ncbi:hypothetical protein ACFVGY_04795 [Streptomyces sp. NPDC127106]|uniref:hypothetical protein n=1 Tax=Streptomyces sp. NPDC127106 TaxID=3345360 RepID=UPI0036306389